jgi:hypothetical protein
MERSARQIMPAMNSTTCIPDADARLDLTAEEPVAPRCRYGMSPYRPAFIVD